MSFRDIAVTIRAVNRTGAAFSHVRSDAESTAISIRSIGYALVGIGGSVLVVGNLAHAFGLLNDEQAKMASLASSVIMGIGAFVRILAMLQTSSIGVAIAEHARAAAHALANAMSGPAGWAILATSAVVAAGAMAYLATQTNNAANAQYRYNAAAKEMPTSTANIVRSNQSDLARRGVENP